MERFLYPTLTDLKDFFWSRGQVILLVGDTPRNRKRDVTYYLPVAKNSLFDLRVFWKYRLRPL
jgi:hypothetical protein